MKTVIALFDSISDADAAKTALLHNAIEPTRISVVTRGTTASGEVPKTEAAEGAGIGATAGALAGGVLAGLGLLALPGFGPLLAAGSIVATLTGAGIGAAAGGLIGGLIGMGIPEHDAAIFSEGIERGGILLTVDANDNDADRIAAILSQHNAIDIEKRAAEWASTGWKRKTRPDAPETPRPLHDQTAEQASRLPGQEDEALDALQKGDIGGPEATPGPRGVDRADVASAGGTIGSVGAGMGESISDIGGTRRTARIYNP
jgi:hypothetical protein